MPSDLRQYQHAAVLVLILLSLRPTEPSIRNFAVALVGATTAWIAPPSATSIWSRRISWSLVTLAFSLSPFFSPTRRSLGTAIARIQEWYQSAREADNANPNAPNLENPEALITLNPIDPQDATVDIVAVHGLASSVETTWTHRESQKNWLRDFLPDTDQLPRFGIRARIMAFRYRSAWGARAPAKDLPDYGKQLLNALKAERREEEARNRPLILIGHSFGGLLIEQAMVLAKQFVNDKVDEKQNKWLTDSLAGIIFLGTPHGGSGYSALARLYCVFHYWDGASTTLLRYLDPGSEKARDLEEQFASSCHSVRTIDYYETIPNEFLGYGVNLVVAKHAATRFGCNSEPLDTNHFGLNKFQSKDDASYKKIRDKIRDMAEEKMEKYTEQALKNGPKSQDVLDWLLDVETRPPAPRYPMSYYEDHRNDKNLYLPIGRRSLESDEFKRWYNGKDKWLWCHGMPGVGKTVLATIIIEYLMDERSQRNIGVACLYCVHSDVTQSALNFVICILHQLAKQSKDILAKLVSLYRIHAAASPPTSPSLEEYETILMASIGCFEVVYLVVDALDECRKNDAKDCELYSDTKSRFLQTLGSLGAGVRLLVTSREDKLRTLDPKPPVSFKTMVVSTTSDDIELYVGERIKSSPRLIQGTLEHPCWRNEIQTKVAAKAAGLILPAKLYMDFLEKKAKGHSIDAVLAVLSDLPSFREKEIEVAYAEAYTGILKDIWTHKDEAERARKALSWVIFSKTTPKLTIDMVKRALTIEDDLAEGNSNDADGDREFDQMLEENILSACRGLVTVDNDRNLHFVHNTAEVYFLDPKLWANDFPDANKEIATACLTCILSDNEIAAGQKMLLQYASLHWGYHASFEEKTHLRHIDSLFEDTERLQSSFGRVVASLPRDWARSGGVGVEPLHVAAYFGLKSTVETLLSKSVDIEVKDASGWTALRWAIIGASNPHPVVALLLDQRADVLSQDSNGLQTIFWAIGNRKESRIEDRLEVRGESVSLGVVSLVKTGQSFATALQSPPLAKTSQDVIQYLFKQIPKADLNVRRRSDKRSLLSVVAGNWQWQAVQTLVDRKADKTARDKNGMTALLWALKGPRFTLTIKNLSASRASRLSVGDITRVDPSVGINIGDSNYAERTFEVHICNLIDDGLDLEAKDESGRTALSLAVENRFHTVVQKLLKGSGSRIADSNTMDVDGMTPLHWACCLPRFQKVVIDSLTCCSDAKVRLGTAKLPPLPVQTSRRVKGQSVERTLEHLLRSGADARATNKLGLTPLALATLDGLESHARLLRKYASAYRDGRPPQFNDIEWAPADMQSRDLKQILVAMLDRRSQFLLSEVFTEQNSRLFIESTTYISSLTAMHDSRVFITDRPHIVDLMAEGSSLVIIRGAVSAEGNSEPHRRLEEQINRDHDDIGLSDDLVTHSVGQAAATTILARHGTRVGVGADAKITRNLEQYASRVHTRGRSVISRLSTRHDARLMVE
ncbi:Ankyrin repeat domain-containing protein 50, partial [Ilyonectria robusta]